MNRQPLFPNRDPRGPSDPLMDQQLREVLQPAAARPTGHVQPNQPLSNSERQIERATVPPTPVPPLLKVYWILCAGLLSAVIQLGCESHQRINSSLARIQTSLAQADASSAQNEHPGIDLHSSTEHRVETWIREDEPAIEVTGAVFKDPFTDFAPRAVLERLPAPRGELVESPAPRAQLVALPQ